MSTGFKLVSVIVALTCLFSCNKVEEDFQQPVELESAGNLMAELSSTTSTTAVFACDLSIHPDAGKSFRAGIMYSNSQKFSTSSAKRVLIENPVDGKHEIFIDGLTFATTYYYATYVYRLGKYELSEVSSFTTEPLAVDVEVAELKFNEVTIQGQVHLDEGTAGKIKVGFKFSDTEDFSSLRTLDSAVELTEDGRFQINVTGLDQGTKYYYTYYLSQGSRKMTTPVNKVITLSPYTAAFGKLDMASASDLSAGGSANCYIVNGPGLYKFKAVKGNSDEPVGDVTMVNVLWESFGTLMVPEACEMIDATYYEDGYAAINVPADFKQGNVVVVAKNASGDVLWSWHFWLTSDSPKEHVYANGAGVMMDRNLGSLSVAKGDKKGFGLLYQWGRKDPFPGSATANGSSMVATTAKVYAAICSAEVGNIDFTVKNPATIILADGTRSSDWLYYERKPDYDNTRWQSEKTIYDPCPAGWRVPDGGPGRSVKQADGTYTLEGAGIWRTAGIPTGGGFPYPAEDYALAGITIPAQYCGEDVWYPAAGSISAMDGTFVDVGRDGVYWSVTPCGTPEVYGFNFYYYMQNTGYVYHSPMLTRATAASVRCCKIL